MHTQPHKIHHSRIDLNRLGAIAVIGTIGATPFLSAVSPAEAAPSYRRERNRGNANITVTGIVQRDLQGNDRFTVRLSYGRTIEVISRQREPLRLSRGDRVELRGDFEGNLFIADRVRIVQNNSPQTTLRGVVTRDYRGREFSLRVDNRRDVTVWTQRSEPLRLSRGDRVEVRGHQEGPTFIARNVTILRNDDRQEVNFPGTVLRREGYNRLVVRADNGRNYTITASFSLSRFGRNDRVRVDGIVNGNTITASRVELLRNR